MGEFEEDVWVQGGGLEGEMGWDGKGVDLDGDY